MMQRKDDPPSFILTFLSGLLLPWILLLAFLLNPFLQHLILLTTTPNAIHTPRGILPADVLHAQTLLFTILAPSALHTFYPDRTVQHLRDVQSRLTITLILLALSLLLISRWKPARSGMLISLTMMLVLSLLAITGFNQFFTVFHETFFPMGNYTFPLTSLIKHLYPDAFFQRLLITAASMSFFFSLLFLKKHGDEASSR